MWGKRGEDDLFDVHTIERSRFERLHPAVHTYHRRRPRDEQQIGALLLCHQSQPPLQTHGLARHRRRRPGRQRGHAGRGGIQLANEFVEIVWFVHRAVRRASAFYVHSTPTGTILADTKTKMKRTLWTALALVAVATVATALLQGDPSNAEAEQVPLTTIRAAGDVQVRHAFVTIATPVPAAAATRRSVPPGPPARRTSREAGGWSKTARALVGDGRHRPQPFPRIK